MSARYRRGQRLLSSEVMELPERMTLEPGYAHFAPEGEVSLKQGIALVTQAIRYCRGNRIPRLLADVSRLTGFRPPYIYERYWMAREWAHEAGGQLVLAVIAQEHMLDPQRFGVLVARNAGLRSFAASQADEAREWLLAQQAG